MVEVLLALAIGGLVLTAATSLLITISRAWAERPATRDAFDAHVNGVAHFMTAVLEEATPSALTKAGDQAISLKSPVGYSDTEDPLIYFFLREGPPLLVWPNGPAGRVHCYLYFEEGEGLSFLWFSEFQELEKNDKGELEPEDEDELFKTLISPLCDQVFYCYYGDEDADSDDIKEWEISKEEKIILPIQVNGKRKTEISVSPDLTEKELKDLVLEHKVIKKATLNSDIKRFIYVPKRIVNVVI